jgi:nitroreductase
VPDEALSILLEAARWAPTAHNMQNFEILVVDDPAMLASLGSVRRNVSDVFLRENYRQLSFSEEELRRRKTGVLASTFPPSWQRPDADIISMKPDFLRDSLQGAQTLLLVLYDPEIRAPGSEGDFLGIMSLGCVMQNLWLAAQSLGISMQILSAFGAAPVQHELRPILRIPETRSVAFACRLGSPRLPTVLPLRVRRELPDFVFRNGWGDPIRLAGET